MESTTSYTFPVRTGGSFTSLRIDTRWKGPTGFNVESQVFTPNDEPGPGIEPRPAA